jgi:tRNA 2-selenouridine synthase
MKIAYSDFNADRSAFDTIIDVRSPAEFAEDHIPGAINLPVLSNDERAEVGTIYVQDDPFKARKIGAALVAKNTADHLQTALKDMPGAWRPLVYCWRGGQRSGRLRHYSCQDRLAGRRPGGRL